MKKVTDPQSIRAKEIPSINDANPTGDICVVAIEDLRDAEGEDEEEDIVVTVAGD